MEHEITGHTRKVYKIWKNPNISFWKKFREIGIEILIIVFAVSLAAFLERQREHGSEQKQVKEFLTGLKTDLLSDVAEMGEDKKTFTMAHKAFVYLTSVKPGEKINKDSVHRYSNYITNTTGLVPNDGRYQGFKSSGKISTIENIELQNDILDLYQENIPLLLTSTDNYTQKKQVLFRLLLEQVKRRPDGSSDILEVFSTDKAYNIFSTLTSTGEILARYDTVINKSKKIIAAIDKEYGK
ncbi:MAG: hypothetical protein V4539_04905 [Bacteroidota bacterium]